jgi:2,4-dienoyl-CoA reductase-like NADH-dependent reductase (Old Yellow Enzyme family)
MHSASVFTSISLRDTVFPNRLFLSPMWLDSARCDGTPDDFHQDHYWRYAYSGLGGVLLEGIAVSQIGRITSRCLGLYTDAQENALRNIISGFKNKVASYSKVPTRIGIQLRHAGIKASMDKPKELPPTEILLPEKGGWIPLGVFSYHSRQFQYVDTECRKMIMGQFVASAERAARAGAELIELHWAHCYLFHQYLSEENASTKEGYGGPLNNRTRFPLEVFAAVRRAVPDTPLGVRVSFGYRTRNVEEDIMINRRVVEEVARRGADYVTVSDRGLPGDTVAERKQAFCLALQSIRSVAPNLPIMAVGGFGNFHALCDFHGRGLSHMFAIGRALLWNPMLIHEWRRELDLPYVGPEIYRFAFKNATRFGPS